MKPLAVTSSRKLDPVTGWPDCVWVWLTSAELTNLFAVVSPRSTPIGTETFPTPFTLTRVIVKVCALSIPLRLTVTTEPLTFTLLTEGDPLWPETVALVKVIGHGKLNIT